VRRVHTFVGRVIGARKYEAPGGTTTSYNLTMAHGHTHYYGDIIDVMGRSTFASTESIWV